MAKTGIKIKRCNVGSVEAHNKRSKEYLESVKRSGHRIYIYQELTPNNSCWVNPRYKGKSCQELFEEMKSLYRDKIGQDPQLQDRIRINKKTGKETTVAGWSPIREGCAPIKEDTKLTDFNPVLQWARKNGIDIIRIDLHFDEGHDDVKTKERKLNRHAHVVFDWVNHDTGKTIKLDDAKMSELQDVMASALGMERGEKKEKTGKDHIPYAEYREMKAAESAAAMEKEAKKAKAERDAILMEKDAALRDLNDLKLQQRKIAADNDNTLFMVRSIESIMGKSLPPAPLESSDTDVWQLYYSSLPVFRHPLSIEDIAVQKTSRYANEYCIKAKVCGIPMSKKLSFMEYQHCFQRIATQMQMAVYKFYADIQRMLFESKLFKCLSLRTDSKDDIKKVGTLIR